MTIYTCFGSEVKVISEIKVGGWITVIRNAGKGQEAEFLVSELKADGGFYEIEQAGKLYRIERECNILLARFEKANWYLSNVIMHPEQWHDHQDAINFAKQWVFECAQAIAEYRP